jgi:hypothetical protein
MNRWQSTLEKINPQFGLIAKYEEFGDVRFIVSLNIVPLPCTSPASTGIYLGGCRTQGHNKRDTVLYGSQDQSGTLTKKAESKIPAFFKIRIVLWRHI